MSHKSAYFNKYQTNNNEYQNALRLHLLDDERLVSFLT